ncbi:hypothetical protein RYH80_04340 [Halobaculum sp. MBLA0147]|uniref:hypothetical protein n=1 Tax=Halobaculum sp. MBLA0147 TaxID=3079934 RepID=UPI0035259B71
MTRDHGGDGDVGTDGDRSTGDDPVVPPAASGDSTRPDESPAVCPVCGDPYESLSDHDAGLMVNLIDNERYRRVCFRPVSDGDTPLVRFFHHTHDQT